MSLGKRCLDFECGGKKRQLKFKCIDRNENKHARCHITSSPIPIGRTYHQHTRLYALSSSFFRFADFFRFCSHARGNGIRTANNNTWKNCSNTSTILLQLASPCRFMRRKMYTIHGNHHTTNSREWNPCDEQKNWKPCHFNDFDALRWANRRWRNSDGKKCCKVEF